MTTSLAPDNKDPGVHHEPTEWTIPLYRLGDFMDRIEKANRRLEKAGLDARFRVTYSEPFEKKLVLPTGYQVTSKHVTATMTSPLVLTLGDFTFVASLAGEEAGYVTRCAPGQNLHGWKRPEAGDTHCDHCKVNRFRNRLYVVRNEKTGELLQLGHSCIELYTGISPKGLWALTYAGELTAMEEDDAYEGARSHQFDYGIPVRDVLALAYAHSDRGRNYIPASRREFEEPTIDLVRTSLFTPLHLLRSARDQNRTYYYFRDKAEEAAKYRNNDALMDAIIGSADVLNNETDYGKNIKVLVAGENVSGKNVGVLASLVTVFNREVIKAEAKAKQPPVAKGFLGPVGSKLTDLDLTVKMARQWEGRYGTTTWIVAYTKDGHLVVWKASKEIDVEPGEPLRISQCKVKEHGEYQGDDQTVITNARLG